MCNCNNSCDWVLIIILILVFSNGSLFGSCNNNCGCGCQNGGGLFNSGCGCQNNCCNNNCCCD